MGAEPRPGAAPRGGEGGGDLAAEGLRPTQRRILLFWIPLAATWLVMALEGPFLAAVIARLSDTKVNLAAFGVALSFALFAEAPVVMMMSAATALVKDRTSYRRLRTFTCGLNAVVTLGLALMLWPPVFDFLSTTVLGLPEPVARRTELALWVLLPWPAAIGTRRFYQGVLIAHGQPRRVAYGTGGRLVAMGTTALTLAVFTHTPGAVVGAAALSVGVLVEALASRLMARGAVRRLMGEGGDPNPEDALGYGEIIRFYVPLSLTALLAFGVHPLVTVFLGHSRLSLESLAVLPVVNSLMFLFRSLGLAYQEVGIALMGDRGEGFAPLRRFAVILGAASALGMGLIVATPLSGVWFERISGLTPALADLAVAPSQILVAMPALAVVLSFQRAVLVHGRRTLPVTLATVIELVGIVAVLAVGVFALDAVGILAAALALVCGRAAAVAYLAPGLVRWRGRADR